MLCVSIIQRRGEPRPHWKCSKVQLTLFSEAAISGSGCIIFVLFPLSRSLLISAADGDIKRSPVVKRPAHNWIIPQSENVGKPRKHFILTSCRVCLVFFIPAAIWRSQQRPHSPFSQNCQNVTSAKISLLSQSPSAGQLWLSLYVSRVTDTRRFWQNIRI